MIKPIVIIRLFLLPFTFFIGCNNSPMGTVRPPQIPLPFFFDNPAWHPEGKWIAVEHSDSVDTDGDGRFDQKFGGIWLVHAGTGEKQPLLRGFGNPAWSRDGTKLALERGGQIFTIEVAGLEPARVDTNSFLQLTTEGRNFFPAWSSDGEWIAHDRTFAYPESEDVSGIWIMKLDGTNKTKVASGRFPDWSSDGEYLIFVGLYREIYRVNLRDTSEVARLTSLNQEEIYATDNSHPKYSPDGTKIAYYSNAQGLPMRVMDADGENKKPITTARNPGGFRMIEFCLRAGKEQK